MIKEGISSASSGTIITQAAYQKVVDENLQLQEKLTVLEHQYAQLKRLIYGQKSERFEGPKPGQLSMELGGEAAATQEPETEEISYKRKKKKQRYNAVRLPIPEHLPREKHVIEPETIPEGATKIGEAVTEILEYEPGRIYVKKYVRPKYALPEGEGVVTGKLPELPIPKGNAGPGLLAHLVVSKFTDHLPFYRQRQQFKRWGISIPESTIGGWFNATAKLLEPLYNAMNNSLLTADYLQADETPIPVLTHNKPDSTHKGYHWVYHDPVRRIVVFRYEKGRGREGPQQFLQGFRGTLQTDGYTAYDDLAPPDQIERLACMAHARRKFEQAQDNDKAKAEHMLTLIQKLYKIERTAREKQLDFAAIKTLRKSEAVPVLEEIEKWLKEQLTEVLPKSAIGQAIAYTLNLWTRLKDYVTDGRFQIDNNLIENTIRPVAIGRKNYLFAGSHEAAQRAAMVYSFLGTCKLQNIEPFQWLKATIEKLPTHPINKILEFMPTANQKNQ